MMDKEKDVLDDAADLTGDVTLAEARAADAGAPTEPAADEQQEEGAPEPLQYQDGTWNRMPNLKCPRCNFRLVARSADDLRAVRLMEQHVERVHPGAWLEGVE